jgi:hypothetical protein
MAIGGVALGAVLFGGALATLAALREDQQPLAFEPTPSPTASPFVESPTPTPPAAEPSPSETPDVSHTPAPVAAATATPVPTAWALGDLPPGVLPPESLVRVALDRVRMREEPGTDAPVVARLAAGEIVYLTHSSRSRDDGYFWYIAEYAPGYDAWPARPPQLHEEGSSYRTGYVALGTPEQPFFELLEPRCSAGEPDLAALLRITAWERLACYGDRSMTLQGTYGCPGPCGIIAPGRFEPEWLAGPVHHLNLFYPTVAWLEQDQLALTLNFNPDSTIEPPDRGTIIRLTGHLDDPRARTCEMAWGEGGEEVVESPLAELSCRLRMVVDSYEVIGTDPEWDSYDRRRSGAE